MIEGSVTAMRTQEGQQTVSNGGGNPSMPPAATKRELLHEDMRFGLESWDSHSSSLMERVGANSWALVLVNQAITEAAQVINEGQNRIS
jgi:hypothetical protein